MTTILAKQKSTSPEFRAAEPGCPDAIGVEKKRLKVSWFDEAEFEIVVVDVFFGLIKRAGGDSFELGFRLPQSQLTKYNPQAGLRVNRIGCPSKTGVF